MLRRAVILADGGGRQADDDHRSAPDLRLMAPILDVRVVDLLLGFLRGHDIVDVVLQLREPTMALRQHLGDGRRHGMRVSFAQQAELERGSTTLVVRADRLLDFDLIAAQARHAARGAVATAVVGDASVSDEVAAWLLEPEAEERRRQAESADQGWDSFDALTTRLASAGLPIRFDRPPITGLDLGTHRGYFAAVCRAIDGTLPHYAPPGDVISPGVRLHPGALCDLEQVRLTTPVVIDEEARIAPGAWLIGPVAVLRGACIPAGAFLRAAVVGPHTRIAAGATIERAIVHGDHIVDVDSGRVRPAREIAGWVAAAAAAPHTLLGRAIRAEEEGERGDRAA
jgi:NDP-sugar pyrophosphorylase family protein